MFSKLLEGIGGCDGDLGLMVEQKEVEEQDRLMKENARELAVNREWGVGEGFENVCFQPGVVVGIRAPVSRVGR